MPPRSWKKNGRVIYLSSLLTGWMSVEELVLYFPETAALKAIALLLNSTRKLIRFRLPSII